MFLVSFSNSLLYLTPSRIPDILLSDLIYPCSLKHHLRIEMTPEHMSPDPKLKIKISSSGSHKHFIPASKTHYHLPLYMWNIKKYVSLFARNFKILARKIWQNLHGTKYRKIGRRMKDKTKMSNLQDQENDGYQ